MRYQKITDLSDDELKLIITDTFHPSKITGLQRKPRLNAVDFKIHTVWTDRSDGIEINHTCVDEIRMTEYGWESGEFPCDRGDDQLLEKFLVAKGCHPLLKNNPYLKATK